MKKQTQPPIKVDQLLDELMQDYSSPEENGAHRPENESVESIDAGEWEYSSVVLE